MAIMISPLTQAPQTRIAGDDWKGISAFLYIVSDPAGAPLDLTGYTAGVNLFVPTQEAPLAGASALVSNPSGGGVTVAVPKAVTGTIPPSTRGTSLQVYLIDPAGNLNTIAIQPVIVVSERGGP